MAGVHACGLQTPKWGTLAKSTETILPFLLVTSTKYIDMYNSVCPLVGIGTLPPPLPEASPPRNQRRAHSPAGEGLGESQFRRLEKKLALCLLCGNTTGWRPALSYMLLTETTLQCDEKRVVLNIRGQFSDCVCVFI
jgi:hypothetical protein